MRHFYIQACKIRIPNARFTYGGADKTDVYAINYLMATSYQLAPWQTERVRTAYKLVHTTYLTRSTT